MESMAFENHFVLLHKSFHVYFVQLEYNFVALWLEVLLKYVANCRNAYGTPIFKPRMNMYRGKLFWGTFV